MADNNTAATALVIPDVPYSITQDPTGTPDDVWYTFTPTCDRALGIRFRPTTLGTGYEPFLDVWTGPVGSLTFLPLYTTVWTELPNVDAFLQLNVTTGTEYFFQIGNNGSDTLSTLDFAVEVPTSDPAPSGSLLISNDTNGFPTALLDETTGALLHMRAFPAFEQAAQLADGTLMTGVIDDDLHLIALNIYTPTLDLVTVVTSPIIANASSLAGIASDGTDFFAVVGVFGVGNTAELYRISAAGAIEDSWTLPAPAGLMSAMAVSGDTVYWNTESTSANQIYRYDMAGSTALSDLVASAATTRRGRDLELTADGDLLSLHHANPLTTGTETVKRYNTSSGALEQTYTITDSLNNASSPRFRIDPNDVTQMWVMTFPSANVSRFELIRLSDGVVLRTFTVTNRSDTLLDQPTDFAASQSCPLLILTDDVTPPPCEGDDDDDDDDDDDQPTPCPGCSTGPGGTPPSIGYGPPSDTTTPPVNTPRIVPEGGEPPSYAPCSTGGDPATASDPTDPQSLTDARSPVIWIQITLPDATVLRYNAQGVNFTSGGGAVSTPRVTRWAPVTHALADEHGAIQAMRTTVRLGDTDRVLRGILASQHVDGSEVVIYAETRENAALGVQPYVLARGILTSWKAVQ